MNEKFKKRVNMPIWDSSLARALQMLSTFSLVTIAWIFFRADNLRSAGFMLRKILHISIHDSLHFALNDAEMIFCFVLIIFLMLKEKYALVIQVENSCKFYLLFSIIIAATYFFGVLNNQQFIYFQF